MERPEYVSCIKINGVPILPPLMTEDVKAEMNYYKQLAIAVEERLKSLELAERDKCMDAILEEGGKRKNSYDSSVNEDSCTETETSTVESAPNLETVIDFPTREDKPRDSQFSSLDTTASDFTNETCKSLDGDESRDDAFGNSTTSNDTITASTDLNQYLGASPPSQRTTTPELTKPQVPKTLDIVPITVEVPEKDKSESESEAETRRSTPPKLVRQGSYILETPSPMLLAHMQTELANPGYVPTTTTAAAKRKEWNISQAKTEWENKTKNKEFVIPDNSRINSGQGRHRRNSMSTVNNQKILKSLSNCKNSFCLGGNQSARSVDCIQTMLDRELVCKSPGGKANKQKLRENCATKSNNSEKILNLANRLGGSLGNLDKFGGHNCRAMNAKNSKSKTTIIEDSQSPSKVAMSEKLMIIFKEIQRKHEEQMAELIAKQQREQNNMQKEFEKQQVLLLGQIEKTFPGISIPQPPETILGIPEDVSSNYSQNLNLVSSPRIENEEILSSDNEKPVFAKCPLDYIYPLNNGIRSNVETSEDEISKGDENALKNMKTTQRSAEKYSNVSRQLFPLDSNTVHVPVPVNVLYTAKHIEAARIINAYARGYLVRRMMKTERVIALKSTYKEALHCMLKLHVDAPLNLPELNFHKRLQLQCDAASMNITELFALSPEERMQIISQDREIKRSRSDRPSSAHSYSFATQRTLARKKLKEMGDYSSPPISRPCSARSRCQTWTSNSNSREKRSQNNYHGIKRSTSAGTVRKPWR